MVIAPIIFCTVVSLRYGVKTGKAQCEQMFSALPRERTLRNGIGTSVRANNGS
jgi:hypothetical protein